MTFNFNIPKVILERLTKAIEKLADDYSTVHATELASARNVDAKGGRTYYQSDAAIVEEELKARAEKAAEEYLANG